MTVDRAKMSRLHEEATAEVIRGSRNPGSGNQWKAPADGRASRMKNPYGFAAENKCTAGKEITVTRAMLAKMTEDALGERPLLALRWYADELLEKVSFDLVAVSADDFRELLDDAAGGKGFDAARTRITELEEAHRAACERADELTAAARHDASQITAMKGELSALRSEQERSFLRLRELEGGPDGAGELEQLRVTVTRLQEENRILREEASTWAGPGGNAEIARLKEENSGLRAALGAPPPDKQAPADSEIIRLQLENATLRRRAALASSARSPGSLRDHMYGLDGAGGLPPFPYWPCIVVNQYAPDDSGHRHVRFWYVGSDGTVTLHVPAAAMSMLPVISDAAISVRLDRGIGSSPRLFLNDIRIRRGELRTEGVLVFRCTDTPGLAEYGS